MFLSTENPPNDPLSSSPNLLHLTSSSHDLAQSHLSNFSIRDYAYSNRKTSIKNNWPFSPKSLQLFSTHGVTDPLPPFQRFSTVKNQFETTSSPGKRVLSYVHHKTVIAETSSKRVKSKTVENGSSSTASKSRVVEILVASTSKNKPVRGAMVKSKDDNSLVMMTSESSVMASKTCPICKTFSSASNTTLNAHIDQCLSVDSELPPVSNSKPNKLRLKVDSAPVSSSSKRSIKAKVVKPKMKIKTMVDIYATAKGCTLEDLDKRNGTKWVSILSYTNDKKTSQASTTKKKRKVPPVGVGPVYIDAKGQKLRILSEFSEKKKTSTSTLCSRKHHRRGKKPHKLVKLTDQNAVAASERGFCGEGSSTGHRRIYNQRMLAKRSLISKKLNEKGVKFYASRDQPSENEEEEDDSWSGEGRDRTVLSATDSYRRKKHKPAGRDESKRRGQSRSFRLGMNETEEEDRTNTLRLKKSLASIREDKYTRRTDALEASDANTWRRLSMPVDLSEEEDEDEEETGKWESEMTQERELSYNDYASGDDDGQTDLRSPSFGCYDDYNDDDEEEESCEEEEEDNMERDDVMDKTDDTIEIVPNERAMYYSEEVENMIYGEANDVCEEEEDVRFDTNVGQGGLFVEVDTIPIPGPPGSFLPSPRDMGFDGNSSVITSQVQSSMDHQLDRNSSESPVSNFAAGRLNFDVTNPMMSFRVPSHHETIAEAEPMTIQPPSRFSNNDDHEPCCCQRKESHHQVSHLLQRRAALTKSPASLDPSQSQYMIQQDSVKFSSGAAVPPSPSTPVLRLMGKDLMVMNQGDEGVKPPPQLLDPPTGTGLYCNTGLYLRNSFEPTQKPQAQASAFRNNFEQVRYFSPS